MVHVAVDLHKRMSQIAEVVGAAHAVLQSGPFDFAKIFQIDHEVLRRPKRETAGLRTMR